MKTILIPTDFTLQSLNMIKNATARFKDDRLNIVLFHALHTPTDIQDLLFISRQVPHEKITEAFRHTCAAIKKKNSNTIVQITFKHLYGNTQPVFRNFLEANAIDLIYMPEHVSLSRPYENSVEVRALFKKAGIPFITDTAPLVAKNLAAQSVNRNMAFAEE